MIFLFALGIALFVLFVVSIFAVFQIYKYYKLLNVDARDYCTPDFISEE